MFILPAGVGAAARLGEPRPGYSSLKTAQWLNAPPGPRPYEDDRGYRDDRKPREDQDIPYAERRDLDDGLGSPQRDEDRRPDEVDGPRHLQLNNQFEVQVGDWLVFAVANYGAFVWPAIGYLFLVGLIGLVRNIPYAGPIIEFVINPALQAGFSVVAIRQLTGRYWTFLDFFGGFKHLASVLVLSILQLLVIVALLGPGIALVVVGVAMDGPPEMISGGIGLLVCLGLPCYYLCVRALFFATPLVVDKNFGPIEAIKGSWRLSSRSPIMLMVATLLFSLIGISGILACFIGILATMPLAVLAWNAGYVYAVYRSRPGDRGPEPFRPSAHLPADYDREFGERGLGGGKRS